MTNFGLELTLNPLQFYYKVKKMLTVVCISAFNFRRRCENCKP